MAKGKIHEVAQSTVLLNGTQAEQEMKKLSAEAEKFAQKKREAFEKNDMTAYNKWDKALKETNKTMKGLKQEATSVESVLKNLNGVSFNELKSAVNKVNNELRKMKPSDTGFKEKSEQAKILNSRYKEMGAQLRGVQSSGKGFFSTVADGFNRYFAVATTMIASFTGIIFSVRKAIDTFNEFEERLDNLSALTGLVGDDLGWLGDRAKELSTSVLEGNIRVRQSATEIVDAFTKTGSARPELLANKEALSAVTEEAIILANASKTELQPAIEALTMVMNQYNVPASEARRIINSIAAGSKAGAGEIPYITTAFEKAGTVAADAGLSIETLVATIETLAPRISQPEIAGRSLKGVLLDLQTTADDTNPSIVGFATALENLGKKQLSITELTKMFGAENITTAKILINNVGELRKYEKAVTGTNVAIEQATINTDNNNSKLAQARNKINTITIALGEKLAPAFTFSTNSASYLIKAILILVNFFEKYGRIIVTVTASILAYNIAINAANILTKLHYTYLLLAEKAQKLFNSTAKANPYALIATAIAGLITWLTLYTRKTNEAAEAQKLFNKYLEGTDELMSNSKSLEERYATIDKMNRKQLEKFIEDSQAQFNEFDALEQKKLLAAQAYQEAVNLVEQRVSSTAKTEAERRAMYSNKYVTAERDNALKNLTEVSNLIDSNKARLTEYVKQAQSAMNTLPNKLGNDLADQISNFVALTTKISEIEAKIKDMLAANQPVPDSLWRQLGSLRAEVERINKALEGTATGITKLAAKDGYKAIYSDAVYTDPSTGLRTRPEGEAPDPNINLLNDEERQALEDAALASAQNTSDAIFDIVRSRQNAEFDAQMSLLDRQREAELSNVNLTEEQKAAINEKYRKKEIKLKQEAFKKEKKAAIIQAVINGALAITKTFATYGFNPAGWIAAAAQAVATGLQIGVISSQKMPEYFAGGFTGPGAWDQPQGIVHSDEFVANRYATANHSVKAGLDIIDYAQKNGTISSLNLPAAMAASGASNLTGANAAGIDNETKQLLKSLKEYLKQPAKAYLIGNADYIREHNKLIKKYES